MQKVKHALATNLKAIFANTCFKQQIAIGEISAGLMHEIVSIGFDAGLALPSASPRSCVGCGNTYCADCGYDFYS